MTITGGSALPKEDIDRMMREAEEYAEDDAKRREEVEIRNQAESLVYGTEKFLTENGEKVPEATKNDVTAAVAEVKTALEGDDVEAVKKATDNLGQVSQAMGTAMYEQAQGEGATDASSWVGDEATTGDDDVVDAEVVEDPEEGAK